MEHNKKTNLEVIDFALTEKGTPLKVKTTDNDGRPVWTYLANGDDVLVITSPGVYPYRGGVIEVSGEGPREVPLTITTLDFNEEVPEDTVWTPVKVDVPKEEKVFTSTQGGMPVTAPTDKIWSPIRISIPSNTPLYTSAVPSTNHYAFKFKNMITNFFDTNTSGEVEGYITDVQPTFIESIVTNQTLGVIFNTQVISDTDNNPIQFTATSFTKYGKVGKDTDVIASDASQISALVETQRSSGITPMTAFSKYVGYYIYSGSSALSNPTDMLYSFRGVTFYEWLFDTDLDTYGYINGMGVFDRSLADLLQGYHGYGIKAITLTGNSTDNTPYSITTTSGNPYFANFQDLEYLRFLPGLGNEQVFSGDMFKNMTKLKAVILDMYPSDDLHFLNPDEFLSGCTALETIYTGDTYEFNAWSTFFDNNNLPGLKAKLTTNTLPVNWMRQDTTGINNNVWWDRRTGYKVTLT